MDTLLSGGDHGVDSRGIPREITGAEELMQRALLRLAVCRGSWFADPDFGSELYRLPPADTETTRRLALSYVREALLPLPQLTVKSVECHSPYGGVLTVSVELLYDEKLYLLEVNP